MSGPEGVVDVAVGIRSEFFGKLFLRLFYFGFGGFLFFVGSVFLKPAGFTLFFGVEAEVFEQQDVAGFQGSRFLSRFIPHAVASEVDFLSEEFFDGGDDVFEREFVFGSFGSPEVRHEDNRATAGEYFLNRGDSGPDTGVVRYVEVGIQGHVEVHTDDGAFTREVVGVD